MAISTYAELQTAVGNWLNRSDLTSRIPEFISLGEARLKRALSGSATIDTLSGVTTSNWVLASHPDLYLYAALVEASPYLKDDERVPVWKIQLDERIQETLRNRSATAYDITTYAGLQTAIKGWLDRRDLDGAVVTFITLAEKSLARDPRLRKLVSATFAVDADDETVPTGFHQLESWYHDGPTYFGPIEIVGAEQLGTLKARHGTTGAPEFAAILDGKFRFAPVPDSSYSTKMTYWKTLGSASAGTSWLFAESPDIYLYASLVAAEPYLKNDARLGVWKALLEQEIQNVKLETGHTHFSGTMRRQFTPFG